LPGLFSGSGEEPIRLLLGPPDITIGGCSAGYRPAEHPNTEAAVTAPMSELILPSPMPARGNYQRGSNNSQAKLNDTVVHIIDILAACDWSQDEIAEVFDITRYAVSAIVRRKNWKHVPRREVSERLLEVLGLDRTLAGLIAKTGKNCRL